MKIAVCLSLVFCVLFHIGCQKNENKKIKSSIGDTTSLALQNRKITYNDTVVTKTNPALSGTINGIATSFSYNDTNNGLLNFTDSSGDEFSWSFNKDKPIIDSTIIGKTIRIYWSMIVDTTLDEANSFNHIDSVRFSGK